MSTARGGSVAKLQRVAGAFLLVLIFPPWYRLLSSQASAAAEQAVRLGASYTLTLWAWMAVGVAAALLLGRVLRPGLLTPAWTTVRTWIGSPGTHAFGVVLGLLATSASLVVSAAVLDRSPILIDGVSQLIQGRYFAAGRVAGPPLAHPEFWLIQFTLLTDAGWVSQYPPGHAALLAVGWWLELPWLVGPVSLGLAVYLTTLCADRLFPADRTIARVGSVLTALSPFLLFHAGAYMNHALASALVVLGLYGALRTVWGSWRWSLLAGAALGALLATRPFTAAVLGLPLIVIVWLWAPLPAGTAMQEWGKRLAGAAAGAGPFVAALLTYNAYLFGNPVRFGYTAAEGPAHSPGFHVDPWGNPYGWAEAVGYTSADLVALSNDLLQAPLPLVAVVALYLLLARGLSRGAVLVSAWALLPVVANGLYWHHDLFMGPRLLYEAAPGWCLLLASAIAWLVQALPRAPRRRVAMREGVAAVLAAGLFVGVFVAGPFKIASYRRTAHTAGMSIRAPHLPRASVVFIHGSWEARLASRLAALGMRLDSVRAALRHNSSCRIELFLAAREAERLPNQAAAASRPVLDFAPAPGPPLRELRLPSGSLIRSYLGETLDPRCEQQAASDFRGVIELAPLLWQGELPGIETAGVLFVRDFGPQRNPRILDQFPGRDSRVLVHTGSEIRLLAYDQAMASLWSGE